LYLKDSETLALPHPAYPFVVMKTDVGKWYFNIGKSILIYNSMALPQTDLRVNLFSFVKISKI